MDWNTRYLAQWWDTDSKADSSPDEDVSRFRWLEYIKNSGAFDSVKLEYCPTTKMSEFNLRKGDFHMIHHMKTPWSAIDSRIQLEIDDMINKFITSPLNRSSTRYDGFYAKAMIDMTVKKYTEEDIKMTKQIVNSFTIPELNSRKLTIKDVIFNDPATIVFWSDGTKTVVKATNEVFDKEKGLAMAITKKFFGNQGNYYNQIKKWLE